MQLAFLVFWNMQCLGLQPNVVTFTSLISGCGKEGQLRTVLSLFDQMQFAGPAPNQLTYNACINASAKVGHFHLAASIINLIQSAGYVLETKTLTPVVHALADVGFLDLALQGLRCMMMSGIDVNVATFDGILWSCIRQKRADIASHLLQEMRAHQIRPRQGTVNALGRVGQNGKAERAQISKKSADFTSTNTNMIEVSMSLTDHFQEILLAAAQRSPMPHAEETNDMLTAWEIFTAGTLPKPQEQLSGVMTPGGHPGLDMAGMSPSALCVGPNALPTRLLASPEMTRMMPTASPQVVVGLQTRPRNQGMTDQHTKDMIDHSPEMVGGLRGRVLMQQPTFQAVFQSLLPMTMQRMQNHDAHATVFPAAHYGRLPAPLSGPAVHVVALPATAFNAEAAQMLTDTAAKGGGNGARALCRSVPHARRVGVRIDTENPEDFMPGEATTEQTTSTNTNSGSELCSNWRGRRGGRDCVDPQQAKLLVKIFK